MSRNFGYLHSAEEIRSFEMEHGISLPQEYVEYLLSNQTGNEFEISTLSQWVQPFDERDVVSNFLKTPFPHVEHWNDRTRYQDELGWDSPYYSIDLATGSIRISNLGCESYALLIVSGSSRGQVWLDKRASDMSGIYPIINSSGTRAGFSEFLELKRNKQIS